MIVIKYISDLKLQRRFGRYFMISLSILFELSHNLENARIQIQMLRLSTIYHIGIIYLLQLLEWFSRFQETNETRRITK